MRTLLRLSAVVLMLGILPSVSSAQYSVSITLGNLNSGVAEWNQGFDVWLVDANGNSSFDDDAYACIHITRHIFDCTHNWLRDEDGGTYGAIYPPNGFIVDGNNCPGKNNYWTLTVTVYATIWAYYPTV